MIRRRASHERLQLHHFTIDESSVRYDGWRIVAVCFLVATFGWAFGFYGQSVYLAELHRLHGWPASLISAATTFFYLFGAVLVVFVSEAVRTFGPRNCLLGGWCAMAAAAVLIGQVSRRRGSFMPPMRCWRSAGPAPASAIITNTLGLWFDQKRGMAISLALNGASFGGIVGVPLLVIAIGRFGFSGAMIAAAVAMLVLVIPVILIFVGQPPRCEHRGRLGGRGCAVAVANPCARVPRYRFPDGIDRIRAGAVRAGRLHRAPDCVPRSRDRARTAPRSRWRC